jgi:hypothetical protein
MRFESPTKKGPADLHTFQKLRPMSVTEELEKHRDTEAAGAEIYRQQAELNVRVIDRPSYTYGFKMGQVETARSFLVRVRELEFRESASVLETVLKKLQQIDASIWYDDKTDTSRVTGNGHVTLHILINYLTASQKQNEAIKEPQLT